MAKFKLVKMGSCIAHLVEDETFYLKTVGISTCIALAFTGQIQGISYIGLYHWAGFAVSGKDQQAAINDIFEMMALTVQAKLNMPGDIERPSIEQLIIIGGEKQQLSPEGEVLISGTEAEVAAIQTYMHAACDKYFERSEGFTSIVRPFLTSQSTSIEVRVYVNQVNCRFEYSMLDNFLSSSKSKRIIFTTENHQAKEEIESQPFVKRLKR